MNNVMVGILEYGSNEFIKNVTMNGHIPSEGDFYLDDNSIGNEGWEDKLYIVKAVTHFNGNVVALHVTKYDQKKEQERWDEIQKVLEALKGGK